MAELEDIFDEQKPGDHEQETKGMSREEWQAKRDQARAAAFGLLEEATEDLADPAALATYLDVQSRFDRYSVSNALMIAKQRPDATRVADFDYWKAHDANIKKGEHAITILEPREYERADGSRGVSYEPKKVFDIAQTTADIHPVHHRHADDRKLIKALAKTSPVELRVDNDLPDGVIAVYSPETKSVSVRQGQTGDEIFRALSQEIAKARAATDGRKDTGFESLAAAYIVCRRSDVAPPALPEKSPFTDMAPKDIRESLKGIREEANNLSAVIGKALSPKSRSER